MAPKLSYRELIENDALAVRDLRLAVMASDPATFLSTVEEEENRSAEFVGAMLAASYEAEDRAVFGAFQGRLIGMIGIERLHGRMLNHKARISGLYVKHPFRKLGVGRALLGETLNFANHLKGVEKVFLEVTGDAKAALKLYEGTGFETIGLERRAIKHKGRYIDEYRMELVLNPACKKLGGQRTS